MTSPVHTVVNWKLEPGGANHSPSVRSDVVNSERERGSISMGSQAINMHILLRRLSAASFLTYGRTLPQNEVSTQNKPERRNQKEGMSSPHDVLDIDPWTSQLLKQKNNFLLNLINNLIV